MSTHHHVLTRRDFLKIAGVSLGGAALACGRGERLLEMTATWAPTPVPRPAPTLASGESADTILVNGNLITIDAAMPSARALAIQRDRILQIGSDEAIRALAGDATQVIDLQGKTVTPGLIDAHNHLQVWGTLLNNYVPLIPPEVKNLDELLARLSEVISRTPAGEWVQGYFWNVDPLPSRKYLDPISPDNPVWLIQQGGHFGAANSVALGIADITADTPDPEGAVIQRDETGEPTGVLYNHRAMDLLRVHAPQPSEEAIRENLRYAEEKMAEVGVTTFHDVNARFSATQAYLEAGRAGSMLLRGEVFYTLEWPADVERALNEIEHHADDHMRFAGYKFLIDGQFPTWYTHEPHPGIRWDMPTWEPDMFKRAVKMLHDTGLQIAVHCGGDAAVDLVLDAYEAAMDANPRPDPRHRLEHATLCTKDAVRRAADLGVQISCQPQFLRFALGIEDKLGRERAARLKVTRDWLDAGINVALGSDTPTAPWYKPQVTLVGAVLRPGPDMQPFHPEQAMTIQEALYAHTMGAAHAAFEENAKGSLESGKLADLTVWSDDLYSIDPIDISETTVALTMIGGKVVYEG